MQSHPLAHSAYFVDRLMPNNFTRKSKPFVFKVSKKGYFAILYYETSKLNWLSIIPYFALTSSKGLTLGMENKTTELPDEINIDVGRDSMRNPFGDRHCTKK